MLTHRPRLANGADLPESPLQHATQFLTPRLLARLVARLRRSALDRALSDGVSPTASPAIAARALLLGRASTRARIAGGLERLALSADAPSSRARITPARAATLANRSELLELASALRQDRRLYAGGIAMLELMLSDGAGPAYTDRRGEALALQLQLARARLTA